MGAMIGVDHLVRLNVCVSREAYEELTKIAKKERCSRAAVARRVFDAWLDASKASIQQ